MPRLAITSPTLAESMPRSRKSCAAASTALRRVRAASSRDRRMPISQDVESVLLAERAVENARGHEPAQPREQPGALSRRIAQAWLPSGGGFDHRFGYHGRIVAGVQAVATALARALPCRGIVLDRRVRGGRVVRELRACPCRLDQHGADAKPA